MGASINSAPVRTRQPAQGTRIRRGNKLAKGLVFATTGVNGFVDFVSGKFPNGKTGANVINCAGGRAAAPAASSGQITWPAGSTGLDVLTGPGTLLVCMRSNNNTRNWRAFGSLEDSSTGDGVYLTYDDQNNASNGFNAGANNNNYRADSLSGALGTNSEQSFHTFGFSWDGSAIQLWADGKLNRTVTGGNAAFSPNSNTGRVTRLQSDTAASDFLFAYAWNRVLSANEIAEITANPWQIFGGAANNVIYADAAGGTPGEATPSGISATVSLGSVVATGAANAGAGGIAASTSNGVATATGAANADVPGVSAGMVIGTASASGAANTSPPGVDAAMALGSVVASAGGSANATPVGVQVVAALGVPIASGAAVTEPAGIGAPASIGVVNASGAATTSPSGLSVVALLGNASATGGAGATTEVDVDRWLLLAAESRVYVVEPESRVLELVGESRVLILEE